jgi:hypothetical protein
VSSRLALHQVIKGQQRVAATASPSDSAAASVKHAQCGHHAPFLFLQTLGESCNDLKCSSLARGRMLRLQCGDHCVQLKRCQILEGLHEMLTYSPMSRLVSIALWT